MKQKFYLESLQNFHWKIASVRNLEFFKKKGLGARFKSHSFKI